jgi:hypothetical protein
VARFEAADRVGDPEADALVAAFAALGGGAGWRALDTALDGGRPEAAAAQLAALLKPLRSPPPWVDFDAVDAGATAFWRAGFAAQFFALAYGSLAYGYQEASLVRPLAATGRLDRMAGRRVGETARWGLDVTTPGSMHPGAEGWRSTIRVRLVHALVRARLSRAEWWDHDAWGNPISATGAFATGIIGFYVMPTRALEDLGFRYSDAEHEALFALWRWISFVMGTPEELLPASPAEAREWTEVLVERSEGPNEDSPRLMRALLRHGLPVPGPLQDPAARVVGGFARRWMGREMADALGVPRVSSAPLVPLLRPATRARAALLRVAPDERVGALERAIARRLLGGGRAPATLTPAVAEDDVRVAA